jgi:predicted acyltransferase (DUF342 family)
MSWKHYGGLRNLDSYNNISVNNIIADKFTVRDKFLTEFQIIGETQLLGNVTLGDNSSNLIDIKSDMIAERNVDIHGDLNINGKLIITSSGEGFFLLGTDDNRLGVNIENPLAVLDIAGSYESVLNIYSDQSNNRNIIARNYLQNGIAVNTIDASSSSIQFYSGTDISNNKEAPDSEIKYLNGGILEIITGQDTRILSQVSISKDGRIGHIHNETLMVYDISNGTYKNLYYKDDTIIKGSAFSLIAYDSSANTSMNITTPDGKGAVISGGAYPKDTDRSMLILDVSNNSEEKPQALMIVSGTANETYNTTTSINKYISQIGKYSLDVNGATYISDSQIKILEEPKMELLDINVHNNDGIALGSFSEDGKFYIYYTENGGLTWYNEEFEYDTNNNIQTGEKTKATDTFINDTVKCFVTHAPSSIPSLFYSFRTPDNPLSIWPQFQSIPLDGTENANAIYSFFNNNVNHFIVTRVTKLNIVSSNSYLFTSADLNFNIKDSKGYGNIIYVVGEAGTIKSYTVDSTLDDDNYTASVFTERTDVSYNIYPSKTYKKVFVYNANTIVAIGNGIITYTHNGGLNWYTIFISEGGTDISLNDIHIKSEKEAIVVGDNGIIYVTHDGYRTWTQLSKDYINGGGTSEYLVGNTSNNITSVTMIDDNTFITTHLISQAVFDNNGNITTPSPESKLLYTYAPSVFNRYNKSTLDVIGSLNVSGDLVLHDRGELKTTDVSFGLLRTNTRQIDFGLSGELITIGAEIGLVDLNGRLQVADDVSLNSNAFISSNLYLSGDASLNSDLFVKGDISANSNFYLGGDASLNSDLFIKGDISANSNFYLGGDASLNSDIFIKGDISANSNFYLGGDASLNSKLFISGDIAANSNFYLTGDASLNSDVFIKGDISANSNFYLSGDASLNSDVFVKGDISANSNFYLSGDASLNSDLFINGDISANSKLNLGGDALLKSKLFISGDISANSKLNLGGDASLKSKLFIGGDISANTNFLLGGDASLNSKLFIGGDISANTNFSLGGDASLKSKLFIGGDISANSDLKLGGDAILYSNLDVGGNLDIGGNTLITGSLTVDGNLNFRGELSKTDISHNVLISDQLTVRNIAEDEVALIVRQDTGISSIAEFKRGNTTKVEIKNNGDIYMNSDLKIMNTTTSISGQNSTAGALYVKGGTRMDGNLNVMGDTHFEGDITFVGTVTSLSVVENAILTITSDNINNNKFTYNGVPLDDSQASNFNINGGANFNDSIDVSNIIYGNKINMSGDVSFNSNAFINSNLYLNGDASLNSKLFISGDISANSKLNLGGDASLKSKLFVNGDISANTNFFLGGDALFNSKLFISGDISANSNIYLGGDASLNSKLFVNSDISANSNFYLGGDASLNSKLFISGDISANSNLYLGGDASLNSKLFVNGDISANSNLYLGGDASLNSKLFISGDISANTNFFLGGDALLNSKLFIKGDISANSNFFLGGDASLNSKLFINGDISANSNLYLGGDALLSSNLIINGDISANSNIYLGGDASLNSKLFVNGDISANTNFFLGGDASLNSKLFIKGDISANSNIYLGGDALLSSNLIISGDISANSNLYLGGDASLNSKLFVNGDISANTNLYLGGDASLNSKLFVSGQTKLGTVYNSGVPLYVDGSGAMRIPVGTTENRPSTDPGLIRFNTTDATFEGYDGSNWGSLGGVSNSDKSSRIYISDASAIVFETNSIIRETIDNSGNISFDLGYGNINMNQKGTATILEIADSSNNNEIRIQNQDDIFKLIYDQSGNETSRIHMTNNEISLYPRYPTSSMLINHNGALIGNDSELSEQLRDTDWRRIGYSSANGTNMGNTVSISRDGKRVAFGEYAVNSTDASSNVHIYTVTEREMRHLYTIKIDGGNVSSIDLNEDGTIIVIGKHNTVPNGQIELWKYDGIDYVQVGVLQNGTTVTAQFGHTTSINNDGTIFAAGQYTNDAGKPGIEGGVLIFNYIGDSITKIADISMNNDGTDDLYNQMGRSIELNGVGDRIVIGGTIDKTISGYPVYRVYVYQKQDDEAWNQVLDITNPTSVGINFGISVAMSNDGKVISVATQENPAEGENDQYGQVLVYDLFGTGLSGNLTSSLRGSAIKLMNINDGDTFGASMSLNDDGSVLAIGSGALDNFNGKAFIYKYLNSDWIIVKTITETSKSNLGGIHDYNMVSGQLISDEDGICIDGTGELVIIGAPNLFNTDIIDGSGNGQVYLYRNQTYTLGVNKKLRVKGDVVVDNGTLDVSGNIIVSGSGINKIISDNYGIGNHIQSTNAGGRNVFEGGSNYIYSQDMGNGDTGGYNRLYATQTNGYNYINATGSGGTNYIEANVTGSNRLKVNGVDKIITNASTTTLSNTITSIKSGANEKIKVEDATTTLTNTNTILDSSVSTFFRNSSASGSKQITAVVNSAESSWEIWGPLYSYIDLKTGEMGSEPDYDARFYTGSGVTQLLSPNRPLTISSPTTSIQSGANEKIKVEDATTTLTNPIVIFSNATNLQQTPYIGLTAFSTQYKADRNPRYNTLWENVIGELLWKYDTSDVDTLSGSCAYTINTREGWQDTGTITERLRVSSNGNVGIGTTNPGSKLEVNGSITTLGGDSFDNLLDPTGVWGNNNVGTIKPYFQIHNTGYLNYPGFDYSFFVKCQGQTNTFGYVYKTINLRGGSWYTVSGARKIVDRSDTVSRDRFYIKVQDITNNIELLSAKPLNDLNVWFDFQYSFYISDDVTVEVRLGTIYDIGTVIAPNLCLNKGGIGARKIHRSLDIYQDLIIDPKDYAVGVAVAAADFKSIHDVEFYVANGGTLYIESGTGYLRLDTTGGTGVDPSMWLEIIPYTGIFKLPIGWVGTIQTTGNMTKTSNETGYNAVYIYTSPDNVTWTERAIEYIFGSSGNKEFNLSWNNSTAITAELYVKLVYKAYSVGSGTNIKVRDIKISRIRTIDVVGYEPSKLIVKFNGNVGIGTTDPTSKLHVYDNISETPSFTSTPSGFNYNSANSLVKLHAFDLFRDSNESAPMINAIRISSYGTNDLPTAPTVNNPRGEGWKSELFIGTIADENGNSPSSRGFLSYNQNFSIVQHISSDTETLSGISATTANHTLPNIGATDATTVAILTCNPEGNVGIGTTNPGAKLEITTPEVSTQIETLLKLSHGTFRPKFNFQSINNGYGWSYNTGFIGHGMSLSPVAGQKITCQSDSSSIYSSGIAFSGGAGLRFYTNQVGVGANTDYTANTIERMRIANDGNVGIGTTDPGEKLHVVGNTLVSGNLYVGKTGTESIIGLSDGINKDRFNITLNNTNETSIYNSAATTRMRFYNNNGNYEFDLHNHTTATDYNALTIKGTNGNVGIGTTNPGAKLHVVDSAIIDSGSRGNGLYDILTFKRTISDYDVTTESDGLAIYFDMPDGNSAPKARIKCVATNSSTFYGSNDEGTSNIIFSPSVLGAINDRVIITGDGRMGIGTMNPGVKLDVVGDIQLSGSLTFNSVQGEIVANSTFFDIRIAGETDYTFRVGDGASLLRGALTTTGTVTANALNIINSTGNNSVGNENIYFGQDNNYGGYICYRATDEVIIYGRRDNGVDTAVFYHSVYYNNVAFAGTVSATSFNATSDIRVKTNIQPILPKTALDQINQLEPKSYQFYDNDTTHFGLIAQEAEQIIPEAVISDGSRMIPSIGEICKLINGGKTIVLDAKTTKDMVATKLEFDDISGNKQSVGIESLEGDKYIHLKESIEPHLNNGDTVFVHGHEVQDFRSINYNTILAVSIAATKELSKELGQTRAELGQTRAELNALKELVNQLINK